MFYITEKLSMWNNFSSEANLLSIHHGSFQFKIAAQLLYCAASRERKLSSGLRKYQDWGQEFQMFCLFLFWFRSLNEPLPLAVPPLSPFFFYKYKSWNLGWEERRGLLQPQELGMGLLQWGLQLTHALSTVSAAWAGNAHATQFAVLVRVVLQ